MQSAPASIVRAYDIRGVVPDQIDESVVRRIGQGFGQWLRARGDRSAVVGRDARVSSPTLYEAAIEGLRLSGIDVHAAGLAPTPVIGWAVDRMRLGGGLIVTASHNPPQFNGCKLLAEGAAPLLPEELETVAFAPLRASTVRGRRFEIDSIAPYLDMLWQRFGRTTDIVAAIDPGNGVTGLTAPQALLAAGARLHAIRATPRPLTGVAADPQDPATLRPLASVTRALDAALGIAWDGDGDRIGVLDDLGRRYEADWLTAVLARPMIARRPGASVLLDQKSSSSVVDDIRQRGGEPLLSRTGYSFFRHRMREQGLDFGGETSGHIMFGPDYRAGEHAPWIDDGVYAACSLLAYLSARGHTLAEEMAQIEPRPISPELRLPCPDERKASIADAVGDWFAERNPGSIIDPSDGARVQLSDGWLHARASNTAPALSLRFEATSEAAYRELAEQIQAALAQHQIVAGVDQIDAPPTVGPQPII